MKLLQQGVGGKWGMMMLHKAQLHGWQTWGDYKTNVLAPPLII